MKPNFVKIEDAGGYIHSVNIAHIVECLDPLDSDDPDADTVFIHLTGQREIQALTADTTALYAALYPKGKQPKKPKESFQGMVEMPTYKQCLRRLGELIRDDYPGAIKAILPQDAMHIAWNIVTQVAKGESRWFVNEVDAVLKTAIEVAWEANDRGEEIL